MRDWIYVDDNVKAIYDIYKKGQTGNSYNIEATTASVIIKL